MRSIKRFSWFIPVFVVILAWGVFKATKTVESKVTVSSGGSNEIVVTIAPGDRTLLDEGDTLRKAFKFNEAIEVYQNVLSDEKTDAAIKAEAQYNIGLCYTWTNEYDKAEAVFQGMLQTYADNGEALANAEYCLAWLEIQRKEYNAAIVRLQRILDDKTCEDTELYARTQFQIGRVYQVFLKEYDKAELAFSKALYEYPNANIIEHPFLDHLRAKN